MTTVHPTAQDSETLASRPSRYAWAVVALLFPVALLNYLDRQIFSTMKKSMMTDLPSIATDERFGAVMGIFLIVYGCCSPFCGYLADRFNRRWAIIISLAVWSLVTWLTGHARTYEQLWWARAAMGVSEACYIPAALALVADYHAGPTRSRAIGVHQAGIYAGIAFGGVGGYIADSSFGWRAAFSWFGLAGILYAVVLLFFLRNPEKTERSADMANSLNPWTAIKSLLSIGSFLLLVVYFTLPGLPGWLMKNWLPAILAETFKLGQGQAGMNATLWLTFASLAGVLAGGILADRWMQVTQRGRIYTSAVGMSLLIPSLFGVGYAGTLGVAICFLILFGIGWGFLDANNMPILCQITRPELRSTAYGLMNFASITVGGWFTKRVGALRDAGIAHSSIFSLCAAAAAVSVIIVLFIRPRRSDGARPSG